MNCYHFVKMHNLVFIHVQIVKALSLCDKQDEEKKKRKMRRRGRAMKDHDDNEHLDKYDHNDSPSDDATTTLSPHASILSSIGSDDVPLRSEANITIVRDHRDQPHDLPQHCTLNINGNK